MKFKFIIIAFLYILFYNTAFSLNILIIPPKINTLDSNITYMEYAVSDIIYKNLILYSKSSVILERENRLDYQNTKGNIKRIQEYYNVDIVITYSVQRYKSGYTLDSFVYTIAKPKSWYEYILYSKEENFYNSINSFVDIIYSYGKIDNLDSVVQKLDLDTYNALIVYYNDLVSSSFVKDYNLYKRFTTFHKNNLYFNIDYLISFIDNPLSVDEYKKVMKELEGILSKKHHYINYIYANIYYENYKKFGLLEDIESALRHINISVKENNQNYIYYDMQGDIYLINNDYENSIKSYKDALVIYSHDIDALNNIIFIYMKDSAKYTKEIIEYSKLLIDKNEIKEDVLETLVYIYKNAGDRKNELYYLNMLLDYINKEISRIKANQLGASPLHKYIQKQKNIERLIKNIKDRSIISLNIL